MPTGLTRTERTLRAQIAANDSWARTENRSARTAPARAALDAKFAREIDPNGELAPAELAKRVENARRAYFQRLALKSAKARRRKAAGGTKWKTGSEQDKALGLNSGPANDRKAAGRTSTPAPTSVPNGGGVGDC
jgi:hypothetical protein